MSEATITPGLASTATAPGGGATPRADALRHSPQESEAIFLARVLGTMTQGMGGDDLLGDGQGGGVREVSKAEIAELIRRTAGIGVADAELREMLKDREVT